MTTENHQYFKCLGKYSICKLFHANLEITISSLKDNCNNYLGKVVKIIVIWYLKSHFSLQNFQIPTIPISKISLPPVISRYQHLLQTQYFNVP